ncbi:hypothetical protein ACFX11_004059 [Malus domestica]
MRPSSFLLLFLLLTVIASNAILTSKPASCKSINLGNYREIELTRVAGPESIAFDCRGKRPYVGVSDGTILKWQGLAWVGNRKVVHVQEFDDYNHAVKDPIRCFRL